MSTGVMTGAESGIKKVIMKDLTPLLPGRDEG
jgi:hypothetical protein